MIKESDKQYLQSIAEKYGNETLYNALLEYSYGHHTFDHEMHSAGQTKRYAGMKGALFTVPSFLLCTLIYPPLSFVLLIGAIANRISAKWHEQKGLLGALNPLSWAEYIATGNYRNKDENGKTIYDGAPRRTAGNNDDRKNIDAGDSSTLQNSISQSLKDIEISKLESLVFRDWFITFDNGEVIKLVSYNEEGAKIGAKALIDHPIMLKRLGAQISAYERYKSGMSQEYSVYKAVFNDGQIFYTVGKTEEEATATAKELVKSLGKAIDDGYKSNHINIQKYKVPNLVRLEIQEKLEIPLPQSVVDISNFASVPGKIDNNEKESKFFWQYGTNLYQVEMSFSKGMPANSFVMKFPTENFEMAKKIVKEILSDFWNTPYGKMLKNDQIDTDKWYMAKFIDGDRYLIHDKDEEAAKRKALSLYRLKINSCKRFISQNFTKVIDSKMEKAGHTFIADSLGKIKEPAPDKPEKFIKLEEIRVSAVYKEYNEVKRKIEKTEIILDKIPLKL